MCDPPFFVNIEGPMLIKESITKVARELKKTPNQEIKDNLILKDYPKDLDESDIKKAMQAIAVVSDVLLKLD